jgi:geranylgeranyl reductase family protein
MLYDVAVIGAGPAGSTLAFELGKKGFDVALLEKDEIAGQNAVCGGDTHKNVVEKLRLPENLIEKKIEKMVFQDASGIIRKQKVSGNFTIKREKFDAFLAERAAKKCSFFHSTKAEKVEKVAKYWKIKTAEKKFNARIIAFADGPASKIRNQEGIGFKPFEGSFFAANAKEFLAEETDNCMHFVFDKKISPLGYAWLFPKKDCVNIGCGFFGTKSNDFQNSKDYLLKKYFPEFEKKECLSDRTALIPAEFAKRIADSRGLIVVGDAAGAVQPISGEGIQWGVESSFCAADHISSAIKNNNFSLLENYEKSFKGNAWAKAFMFNSFLLKALSKSDFVSDFFLRKIYAKGYYEGLFAIAGKALRAAKPKEASA